MSNTTREQEKSELHRIIWTISNDLRGTEDVWDFKQYVLGMLFYRYISENLASFLNKEEQNAGDSDFDYAKLSDTDAISAKKRIIETKGFFILPSELFSSVQAKAHLDENLNETLETIFKNIEFSAIGSEGEDNLKGLFDDIDVNSNKLGANVAKRNERLARLINGVAKMPRGNFQDNNIDAYEFLMDMYASNAEKSGDEYFTPQEVSELFTHITLGRISMFLHDIPYDKFNIVYEDTLINPLHGSDEPFKAIVFNPPYSTKWKGTDNLLLINDERFSPAGVLAPKSKEYVLRAEKIKL